MQIDAGPVHELPTDRCVAIGDGAAVIARSTRTDSGVVAFTNRCLHQDSPLADGWIRNDVLSCPLHFWRYDLPTGELVGGGAGDALEVLPVSVVDGNVVVTVPDPPSQRPSLREQLLARAGAYDRAAAFRQQVANPSLTNQPASSEPASSEPTTGEPPNR